VGLPLLMLGATSPHGSLRLWLRQQMLSAPQRQLQESKQQQMQWPQHQEQQERR
jgi:hypothetical protein